MRKYLLLPAIILQTTFLFGQTSADWSSWITHDCYKGIKYKIANWGKVSGDYSDNYWGIMFENTYSQPVSFSYHLSVGGENPPTDYNYTVTYKIQPGGTYSNDATKATAILFKSNSPNYGVYIKDVCLGDCENKNYINCQGIKQNSTITTNNSNSNSTSNTNTNSTNNNPSSSNTTYSNNQITTANSNNRLPNQTTTYSSPQSNQVINTQQDNTNTEVLNVLESTMNQVTNSIANSIQKSTIMSKENNSEIIATQEQFAENNLTDKEIDSLLSNPDPSNYATINIYSNHNPSNEPKWNVIINGKKMPMMDNKNNKLEYRIYSGNKLVVQVHPIAAMGTSFLQSITTKIRKGKSYHFLIKRTGMISFSLEQIEEEPLDKKGNKKYENANQKIKSDIDY